MIRKPVCTIRLPNVTSKAGLRIRIRNPDPDPRGQKWPTKVEFFVKVHVLKGWMASFEIRIRIGIQPKMLDPDPDEINEDPQPCSKILTTK
jgi:hypothetical protein